MKSRLFKGIALGVMLALGTGAAVAQKAEALLKLHPYLSTEFSVLSIGNPTAKAAKVIITDQTGDVVYKEWVSKEAFSQKVLDFNSLEDGNYTAKLTVKGEEIISEDFALVNNKVSDETIMTEEELRAFFRLSDNILYVSHIAFGANTFGISIEDAIGDQVFEKGFEGNATYSGKFDISALPNGTYSVRINSGAKEYSYAFSK